jgi:subtilisin family serine protease
MKRILLNLFACLFVSVSFYGQSTRMNAVLISALNKDVNKTYAVLVKGNIDNVKAFTKKHKGLYKYNCGSISSVCLTGTALKELAQNNFVSRIEYYENHVRPLDDTSIIKNNILKIHNGVSPLAQAYDGKGVTFGLVDTGIDFNHPDFKDSTAKTRVKYLWDQTLATATNTPMPYNYGQDWDKVQIDSGHCTHDDAYDMGHGTKVSGVAAGNGLSNPKYKGLAPKADIICVALDFASTGPVVLDGINYFVTKAISLGQPFVLNLSIGDYFGSHDAQDLQAQAIDTLFANIPGRCVVAAAGNAGNVPFHLSYTLSADTNFTFMFNAGSNQMQFLVYADTTNFKQANFSIGVCDNVSFRYVGNIGFRDITSCLGMTKSDTLWNTNHDRIGIIETTADIQGNTYEMMVNIAADSAQFFWTLENTGQGKFDSWNTDFLSGSSAPAVSTIAYYKSPDTLQTICTSFQCSDEVITVANYAERTGHTSVNQVFVAMPGPYDTLVYDCSRGPTRDGRLKPDIAATGDNIVTVCTLPLSGYIVANWVSPQNDVLSDDSIHIKFDGTSSASPSVAGFAVLYLQKYPMATNRQIKTAITGCAKQDYYTGSMLPNVDWGYGKLDGYNALFCGPLAMQSALLNHEKLKVFPNPANDKVEFIYEKEQGAVDIKIYSVLGNEVRSVKGTEKSTTLSVQNFPQGLYLYKVFQNQNLINEGKFVKE